MHGEFYEFVKLALFDVKGGEEAGRGAVKEVVEKAKPYKKELAGLGLGALAGKALLGRGALGALLGLGAARHKELAELGKKGYKTAKGAVKKGEK
jgi:hypothetical protein